MIQVEAGRWHSLEVLEEGTVVFESKDGRYEAVSEGCQDNGVTRVTKVTR